MALRLRRGTNAERLLVTPLEGELIYTTDTKILYIGDGVTQGGLQVTGAFPESINDLNDVDIASLAPEVGQVLKWNGIEFIPADLIEVGEQANIDIIADDSTILIDSETQNIQGNIFTGDTFVGNLFNGTFVGDGSGLTNLPIATDGSGIVLGSNYRINIAADDSTIIVDTSTSTFRGTFVGNVESDILYTKGSKNTFFDPLLGIIYDPLGVPFIDLNLRGMAGDMRGTLQGNIINESLTKIILDHATETFYGDLKGSVFGDDSSIIVDGLTGNIYTENIFGVNRIQLSGADNVAFTLDILSKDRRSILNLLSVSDSDISAPGTQYGTILFGKEDINGRTVYGGMAGERNRLIFVNDSTGQFIDPSRLMILSDGSLVVGGTNPQAKLDVRGNAIISGDVQAASFKGSLVADDSTIIIDGIEGNITAPGYIQFGSFTTTERNSFAANNGMVIYNTTVDRFQGYQSGAWINLDDGSVA